MMLKCGQKDNINYRFGLRKEQTEGIKDKENDKIYCSSCGNYFNKKMKFCSFCGERIDYENSKNSFF